MRTIALIHDSAKTAAFKMAFDLITPKCTSNDVNKMMVLLMMMVMLMEINSRKINATVEWNLN